MIMNKTDQEHLQQLRKLCIQDNYCSVPPPLTGDKAEDIKTFRYLVKALEKARSLHAQAQKTSSKLEQAATRLDHIETVLKHFIQQLDPETELAQEIEAMALETDALLIPDEEEEESLEVSTPTPDIHDAAKFFVDRALMDSVRLSEDWKEQLTDWLQAQYAYKRAVEEYLSTPESDLRYDALVGAWFTLWALRYLAREDLKENFRLWVPLRPQRDKPAWEQSIRGFELSIDEGRTQLMESIEDLAQATAARNELLERFGSVKEPEPELGHELQEANRAFHERQERVRDIFRRLSPDEQLELFTKVPVELR